MRQIFLFTFLFNTVQLFSQVTLVPSGISPYYVTPESLVNYVIINNGPDCHGSLDVSLVNRQTGIQLLNLTTEEFKISSGNNTLNAFTARIRHVQYTKSDISDYIQTTMNLPSGLYSVCATLKVRELEVIEKICEDVQSDFAPLLELVYPIDNDTIESEYPMLIWTHSGPFVGSSNEYYRIVVTEVSKDQSPSVSISVNNPVFLKDLLDRHQIQYPLNARKLESGKTYAWQIQRFVNGVITNKSETWVFHRFADSRIPDSKFATLYPHENTGIHYVKNKKLFFHFNEEYRGERLVFKLRDSKKNEILPTKRSKKSGADDQYLKNIGYNEYMIDLSLYSAFTDVAYLEVYNEKNEKYYLRFICH